MNSERQNVILHRIVSAITAVQDTRNLLPSEVILLLFFVQIGLL
jgi:hypothetical protein